MSSTSAEEALALAKANLAAAQAEAEREQRENSKRQLVELRAQAPATSETKTKASESFRQAEAKFHTLRARADELDFRIENPNLNEFPTEAELGAWETEKSRLVRERDSLRREALEARGRWERAAGEFNALEARLAHLRQSITNSEVIARGERF